MKKIKRILMCFFVAACAVCYVGCFAESETEYINSDGFITMAGDLPLEAEGTEIPLIVCKYPAEWTNEENWKSENSDAVAFYDSFSLGSDKKYCFNFVLEKSGIYNVYIASKASGVEKRVIKFINSGSNAALVSEMLSAQSAEELKNVILGAEIENLGIFDFKAADISENINSIAEIVYKEIENNRSLSAEELGVIFEKSVLSARLNTSSLGGFSDYKFLTLYNDEIFKYINSANEASVIAAMAGQSISAVSDFDEKLMEATVLATVNKDKSITLINEVLNKYSRRIGITKQITDSLCSAMVQKAPFASCAALVSFANSFSPSSSGGSPGGGGAGGGGGSSSGGGFSGGGAVNRYNNTEYGENTDKKTPPSQLNAFDDVSGVSWAVNEINALYKQGIINGKGERVFCPFDYITRAEFTKVLMLGFNVDLIGGELPFSDVSENDWAFSYIKTAYLAGVVNGVGEDVFGKELNISRQDLCVMVYRIMKMGNEKFAVPDDKNVSFKDYEKISDYALEAVCFMQNADILSGDEKGNFNPLSPSTRAEAAKIVYRALELYQKTN